MGKTAANWAFKLALTAAALAWLMHKVDLAAAWQAGRVLSPVAFIAAVLLQLLQISICALRWQAVLRAIGAPLSFRRAVILFSIGNFFGQILPGAVGGDAVRMMATRRAGLSLTAAINSVMLERAATVYALLLLTTLAEPALLARLPGLPVPWLFPALTLAASAVLLLLSRLDRLPQAWRRWRLVRGFSQLAADTRACFLAPRRALPILLIALIGHVNLALLVWVLGLGLALPVTLTDCLVLVPPVVLVATLPISIAGWGAREVAMITLFGLIGIPATQATALSVLFGLSTLLIALPGGLLWLLERHAGRPSEIPGENPG